MPAPLPEGFQRITLFDGPDPRPIRNTHIGDMADAFQAGLIGTGADLAEGIKHVVGSDLGIGNRLRTWEQRQYGEMSPEARAALLNGDTQGMGRLAGFGLRAAHLIGEVAPALIPVGGLTARVVGAGLAGGGHATHQGGDFMTGALPAAGLMALGGVVAGRGGTALRQQRRMAKEAAETNRFDRQLRNAPPPRDDPLEIARLRKMVETERRKVIDLFRKRRWAKRIREGKLDWDTATKRIRQDTGSPFSEKAIRRWLEDHAAGKPYVPPRPSSGLVDDHLQRMGQMLSDPDTQARLAKVRSRERFTNAALGLGLLLGPTGAVTAYSIATRPSRPRVTDTGSPLEPPLWDRVSP